MSGQNVVDGDISTWWQSPTISRGLKYNRVTLSIDLVQVKITNIQVPVKFSILGINMFINTVFLCVLNEDIGLARNF
jgi:hypothetical protein